MGQPIGLFVEAIGGDEDEAWRQNNKEVLTLMATANTPSMSVDQQCYNTHFVLFNSIIAWCAISGVWCYIWSLVLYLVFYICRETDASYSSIQQPQKPLHSFTKTLKGSKILLGNKITDGSCIHLGRGARCREDMHSSLPPLARKPGRPN